MLLRGNGSNFETPCRLGVLLVKIQSHKNDDFEKRFDLILNFHSYSNSFSFYSNGICC